MQQLLYVAGKSWQHSARRLRVVLLPNARQLSPATLLNNTPQASLNTNDSNMIKALQTNGNWGITTAMVFGMVRGA